MLVCISSTFANIVSQQDAQTLAVNFFKVTTQSRTQLTATLKYTRTEADNTVDFYAFDMSPVKGFVIVSATDNDIPVIGYSTESYFPTDFSKIGLKEWLNRWSEELHYVILHNVVATPAAATKWAAYRQGVAPVNEKVNSVAPFCPTLWDQNTEYQTGPNLYNNYCPGGTGTNQAVTGCVATTMAQIMRYWKYPVTGIGTHSYQDATSLGYQMDYGTLSFNYGATTFDWANMPAPSLTNTSTTAQINAVGTLMYAAGVSVEMDYSPNGSGAMVIASEAGGGANAQSAYVTYFGYQNIIRGLLLASSGVTGISNTAFIDSIEADLNAGRLVQVQGSDPTNGGHTWVCDGYNTSNQFHMNWGWSGYANGYFAVTTMNPNDGTQLNFSQDVGALTHIQPPGTGVLSEVASASGTSICAGSSVTLHATTHTNATYSWTPTTGLSSATSANPTATPTTTTTYTVTADSAGITATSSITITVHASPTSSISGVNPKCYGSSNGTATVTASGGTAAYHYVWNNGQTAATATNLAPGTYTVTITDANSCSTTATKTLTQPTALSASTTTTNATCGQPNGSIVATVSGGTTGYSYHWSNGATTATASNLAGASYVLTVTDANSCSTTVSATITSSGTLSLVTSATNATCYGNTNGSATATVTGSTGNVTYTWSNGATTSSIQNVPAATYVVTITDGSGCSATSSKAVTQPSAITVSVNAVAAGCGNAANGSASISVTGGNSGYHYSWSNGNSTSSLTGLTAGSYHLTVTDANNCSTTAVAVIATANAPVVSLSATNATCYGDNNGSALANISSGTAPYSYVWNNGATTSSLSNLAAGTYNLTVTDANHCTSSTNVTVSQPSEIQITTNVANATGTLSNGSASVTNLANGTAPYTYIWSTGATTQIINNLSAGYYTVTVTDYHGCVQTATVLVNVTTGIGNIANAINFSIYPNPARTQVLVSLDAFNGTTTLSLKNILGQTMISQTVTAQQTELDLSSLANGVYLIEVREGDKAAVKQLVVVK